MKVKRIASYETTDGKLFTDKNDAKNHQRELDRKAAILAHIKATLLPSFGIGGDLAITPAELTEWLLQEQAAIRDLLPQRAPRKAEAEAEPQDAANDVGEAAAEPVAA